MSTNAMIYAKQGDGSIKGVYLHWDGYPGYAGDVLLHHYNTNDRIQKLIDLGSISSLGENPEPSELIARFGFSGPCYPTDGVMPDSVPEEWKALTQDERKQLQTEDRKHKNTIAYARDRGEPIEWTTYPTVADLKKTEADYAYEYYWDGNAWFMRRNKVFRRLTQAMCDRQE